MSDQIAFYNIVPELMVSKNIALVGNSNSLLNKKYGPLIDTYDDIIRFNYGDLDPPNTGSKTTIRWINCPIDIASASEHNKGVKTMNDVSTYTKKILTGTKIICWESLQDKLKGISGLFQFYLPNGLCTLGNINSYLEVLNVKHRFTVEKNCWPRTGFQAVMTCLRSGCIPHLFGFDVEHKKVIKHYSLNTNYQVAQLTQHQVDTEVSILNELRARGLIVVHT